MKVKFNEVSLSELEREYKAKVEADKCSYEQYKKNDIKCTTIAVFICLAPVAILALFFASMLQDFSSTIAFLFM